MGQHAAAGREYKVRLWPCEGFAASPGLPVYVDGRVDQCRVDQLSASGVFANVPV
jgi:hypothetical protein